MKSKRIKYFIKHLIFSIIVAFFIVGLVFYIWYPLPLAKAVGVTDIFIMLLTVDIVLGPLLGLLVYKSGKKSLKFDLSIIVLIQIIALGYGVFSISEGRPSWIVYTNGRFELVRNNDIINDHIANADPKYKKPSLFKPKYVAVKYANTVDQKNNDVFTEVFGGVSLAQMPDRYQSINRVKYKFREQSQNLSLLNQFNLTSNVNYILKQYPHANAWLPLKANAVDMVVLINKEKAEIIKIVDLRPWS